MAFGGSGFGNTSGFGSSSIPSFGTPNTNTGLFGNFQSSNAFGTSTPFASTPAFGSSNPIGGGFGNTQSIAGSGSTWAQSQASPFGQPPPVIGGGLWGSANGGNPNTNLGTNQQPNSRTVKYQVSVISESGQSEPSKYHTISAMEQFRNFSVEEIRLADYQRGDRGGDGGSAMGTNGNNGLFGNAQSQPSNSLFGNTSGSGFGSGGGGGLFSASQTEQRASGGLFGNSGSSLFGGQQQQSSSGFGFGTSTAFGNSIGFGNNPASTAFPASSASLFGNTTAFGAQPSSNPTFTQNSTPAMFGQQQSSSAGLFGQPADTSTFAQSSSAAFGFGASASSQSWFGNTSNPPQSNSTNLFATTQPQQQPPTNLFGASSAPAFTSTPANTAFGGFGSSAPTANTGFGTFGSGPTQSSQSAPSLFGSAPSASAFGPGFTASNPTSGGNLFGASSSSFGFGASSSNLFGPSSNFGFSASSGSNLFNTGGSIFSNTQSAFGAPSSGSMFGSGSGLGFGSGFGFGNNQQQQQQQQPPSDGPLQASLNSNPYGSSNLFVDIPKLHPTTTEGNPTSIIKASVKQGQTQELSVVLDTRVAPTRRIRGSETIARQSTMLRKNTGASWLSSGNMRPWNEEGSLFNPALEGKTQKGSNNDAYGLQSIWRTEEQRVRAANIKKLVIDPMDADQLFPDSDTESQFPMDNGTDNNPNWQMSRTPQAGNLSNRGRPESVRFERSHQTTPLRSSLGRKQKRSSVDGQDGVDVVDLVGDDNVNEKRPSPVKRANQQYHLDQNSPADFKSEPVVKNEDDDPRFASYSDYYRTKLSSSRRVSIGNGDLVRSKPDSSIIPKCANPDMYTVPSIAELENMSEEELAHVEDFTVGKTGIGEVTWTSPTDVRGLDLDDLIAITPRNISVYPRDDQLPPRGEGLNKNVRMKLHGIWKKDKKTKTVIKTASAAAKMVHTLKNHCDENGWEFLGYDVRMGTWSFGADGF